MTRRNLVAIDSENEAKLRAYFEVIPAYLLNTPDIRWLQWLFNDNADGSIFYYIYSCFGVDDRGQRQTSDPDSAKGLSRRWRVVPYKQIADAMGLGVPAVKKSVKHLQEYGFVDVTLISEGGNPLPHFCMNWDRLLSALIEAVNSKDPFDRTLVASAEDKSQKVSKKGSQINHQKNKK